jgi:hypothetical protein
MEDVQLDVSNSLSTIVQLKTGIPAEEFLAHNRKRKFVMARCVYTNLMHVFTNLTDQEIADLINKDRTSVYHMYKIHEDLISVDKNYRKLFEECSDSYVALVCSGKHEMIEPAILMERLIKAEREIKELKELITITLSTKSNDELVTG